MAKRPVAWGPFNKPMRPSMLTKTPPPTYGQLIRPLESQPEVARKKLIRGGYDPRSPNTILQSRYDPKTQSTHIISTDPSGQVITQRVNAQGTVQYTHEVGISALSAGTHPQMWRKGTVFAKLGPTKLLEPQIVLKVQLNLEVFLQYEMIMRSNAPFKYLTEQILLESLKNYVYRPLEQSMIRDIEKLVPKDSGRLQGVMKQSIGPGSSISGLGNPNPFFVVLSAGNVEYARPVANMPSRYLKHPGMHGNVRSNRLSRYVKKSHMLYDPTAETDFFNKIANNGRTTAEQLMNNWLNGSLGVILEGVVNYYQKVGMNYNKYTIGRMLFGVQYS